MKALQSRAEEAEKRARGCEESEVKLAATLMAARAVDSVRARAVAETALGMADARELALICERNEVQEGRTELKAACKVLTQALQAVQTRCVCNCVSA